VFPKDLPGMPPEREIEFKGQPNRVRGPTHFEFDAVSESKTSTR
jgi:hypothetical protein